MKHYPALDVRDADPDLVAAAADAFAPTAIEERDDITRVFFTDALSRDTAASELATMFAVEPIDVSDEDWARRSQENLRPITVGRITIVPEPAPLQPFSPSDFQRIVIVIRPSMGFGTGHHATTRLCLAALQELGVDGRSVLDVGTGSGVLAIAADRLGAAGALGIDTDPDAIESARENLAINPEARHTRFAVGNLETAALPASDVVLANLTGGLLVRAAERLVAAVRPGGLLVVSGLLSTEQSEVSDTYMAHVGVRHLHDATQGGRVSDTYMRRLKVWERREDEWVGLGFRC